MLAEGEWADKDALAPPNERPASELDRLYRQVEAQLPFWGGPSATELAELQEASSMHGIVVEPLMDPRLWGGQPTFPRYLIAGTR